ncbi:DUF4870 domain-containing protein [Demequina sp. NBRC 110056]|uniref:DUF4870 domain-containing protein n=1 Tax=Demequina sp. NBRC 110056 TaxID=1570345 RepID=UPI000A05B781|nr:DUF4870 domain-containing protein [Demequina sp. NBRC 110056]
MTDDSTMPPPPPEQPSNPQPAGAGPAPVSESDERTMGLLTHLSAILIGLFGPLIFWLIYKERSDFLNDQGKEALNFNITVAIAYVVSYILMAVTFGILFFLPFLVWVVALVFQIMGGMAANKHQRYRYPFALRLVK